MTHERQQLCAAFQAALPGLREELADFIDELGLDAPRDLICQKLEAQGWEEDAALDAATETIGSLAFDLRNHLLMALARFVETLQAEASEQPPIEEASEQPPIEEAAIRVTIGPYSFDVPLAEYQTWIDDIKQHIGTDPKAIVYELMRRLDLWN